MKLNKLCAALVSGALLTVSFLFMFIHEKHGERQPEG